MSLAMKPLLPPPPAENVVTEERPIASTDIARGSTPAFELHPPLAVVTESAEAVYIHETRDTLEAPPLRPADRVTAQATPVALPEDTTSAAPAVIEGDVTVPAVVDASALDQAAARMADADDNADAGSNANANASGANVSASASGDDTAHDNHDDKVAKERGLPPIRVPTKSTAFVPLRPGSSRPLLVAACGIAGMSVSVAVGAVLWARSAVAAGERVQLVTVPVAVVAPSGSAHPSSVHAPSVPPSGQAASPVVAPRECSVSVRASHPEATVWFDGANKGVAPQTLSGPCGTPAVIEVRHPRYADFKRQLTLDGSLEIDARLEREKTELTVWSEPAGATVTYEGVVIGKTPLITAVSRYEQGKLDFQLDGYEADWRQIVPKDAKKTVAVTLRKRP